jgi:5-methylcytosine-specific restriction endonuclease McrA
MTRDRRAKRHARVRQGLTGRSYTVARRETANELLISSCFVEDCCANCLDYLDGWNGGLFCSELCQQTASVVRYWRAVERDGRVDRSDVKKALQVRMAHLLDGGYPEKARRLSDRMRELVWERDRGRCRVCGEPGEEVDHIRGSSGELDNLQLLCTPCHLRKTTSGMERASDDDLKLISDLHRSRVVPDVPMYLCDDELRWRSVWSGLRKARRDRLREELAIDLGEDVWGYTWAEVEEELYELHEPFDDENYGVGSYYWDAMQKDN